MADTALAARRLAPVELRRFARDAGRVGEIPLLRDLAAEARSLRVDVDSLRAELEALRRDEP